MISVQPIENPNDYDQFVAVHPQRVLYHQREWLHLLHRNYGYQPLILVAWDADAVVGVLPLMRVHGRVKGRRLVGLPFSHDVPILTTHPDAETALLDAAIELTQRDNYAYLEIRATVEHPRFASATLHNTSELDITPDEDTLFAQFSRSNRRNIRMAERSELTFREGTSSKDFDTFYDLEVTTRHEQGAPMYPPDFFRDLARSFPERARLYFMLYEGRAVASMIMLNDGSRAIYGYSNNTREPEVMKLKPQNLLLWRAIQASKAAGYHVFDFGTTPLHHTDLLAFKERYSPLTRPLSYSYFLHTRQQVPVIKRDGKSVQMVERVLRMLPRDLFRRLSPYLLREVG